MRHQHHHHHEQITHYNKAFVIAISFNVAFVIIEVIYALMANSMSLLADAGHNLGDVLGLVFAAIANWLLTRRAKAQYSYGYKRTSIIAAISNALLLIVTSALIAYESMWNLLYLESVNEIIIIIVAFIGILINGGTALLFLKDRHRDLNIRGAYLHLAYDALISVGVVLTGILIYFTNKVWLDPVAGLLIVIVILTGTWSLLRDSVNMMMDAVPHDVDIEAVANYLKNVPGVHSIHDLHVWSLSTRDYALTAHLIMPEQHLSDTDHTQINYELHERFNINHVTLQVEKGSEDDPCGQTVVC